MKRMLFFVAVFSLVALCVQSCKLEDPTSPETRKFTVKADKLTIHGDCDPGILEGQGEFRLTMQLFKNGTELAGTLYRDTDLLGSDGASITLSNQVTISLSEGETMSVFYNLKEIDSNNAFDCVQGDPGGHCRGEMLVTFGFDQQNRHYDYRRGPRADCLATIAFDIMRN